jgi:hypothetical protein
MRGRSLDSANFKGGQTHRTYQKHLVGSKG